MSLNGSHHGDSTLPQIIRRLHLHEGSTLAFKVQFRKCSQCFSASTLPLTSFGDIFGDTLFHDKSCSVGSRSLFASLDTACLMFPYL